jgi:hypothetical protein
VFPVRPGAKRPPAVRDWEPRATTDPERIRRCWSAAPWNVGVACGPSGLVVIDCDAPKPGRDTPPEQWRNEGVEHGLDVLAVLAERAGQPFPFGTYAVRSGRGGVHLYFHHPQAGGDLRNTQGSLGWLIDSRAHGGYVLAPGSLTGDGAYTAAADVDIAPLPGWLAAALRPPPLPAQQPVTVALPDDRRGAFLDAAVRNEVARVTGSPPHGHNTALYRAAVALGQLVAGGDLSEAQVTGALTQAAADVGQGRREAARTIASGLRAGARRPRTVAA